MKKKVSLKDIAREVGVSTATVSIVLNNSNKDSRISKKVADHVWQIAKELGYQPNVLARSLRVGKTFTIGVVVADISNLFFAQLVRFIQEEAECQGYAVIITNTNEDEAKMGQMIQILRNRQVDGFIIVPAERGENHISEMLNQSEPVVLVDRTFPFLPVSSVMTDNYQASFQAAKLLIEQGCKRIGMIAYSSSLSHMFQRKSGFSDALKYKELFDETLIKEVRFSHLEEDIHFALNELLHPDVEIDGLLFGTNSLSLSGIRYLNDLQIDIPKRLKVVSFDKNEAFDFMSTPIPYVAQPIQDISQRAVQELIAQIKGDAYQVAEIKINACLVQD